MQQVNLDFSPQNKKRKITTTHDFSTTILLDNLITTTILQFIRFDDLFKYDTNCVCKQFSRCIFNLPQFNHVDLAIDIDLTRKTLEQMTNLRELCIPLTCIGAEGCVVLAECTALQNVRKMNLNGNGIKDDGVSALADSKYLTNLEVLLVGDNYLSGLSLETILQNMKNLKELDMTANSIQLEEQLDFESGITSLTLANCNIDDETISLLELSKALCNLTDLNVLENEDLSKAFCGANLIKLNMDCTAIGDAECIQFAKLDMPKLETLILSRNDIGDEGVKSLATTKLWNSLKFMCLTHNSITKEGVEYLNNNANISSHTIIELKGMELDDLKLKSNFVINN